MKKNPQGKRWRRLDNTGKIFPMIANENLSSVFRIPVVLKHEIDPVLLQQALGGTLPRFRGSKVKLKRGFFWYYFEGNKRTSCIEKENTWPCRYIDPRSNQLYLFRVSYYQCRVNLEVLHAATDGMGVTNLIRELTTRYSDLRSDRQQELREEEQGSVDKIENNYLKNCKETPRTRYNSKPAYHLEGNYLPLGRKNVVHGRVNIRDLKQACRARKVSVTKYLTTSLIWSICQVCIDGEPGPQQIEVNLPINLRAFLESDTSSNFFTVTGIYYGQPQGNGDFDSTLASVYTQMDEKIVKEKLEQTISYNVPNEKKWYVYILPLYVKWLAPGFILKRNGRAHIITLSNTDPVSMDEKYQEEIENFLLLIGVSKRQPAKCGICAYGDTITITFTKVFDDDRLEDCPFQRLKEDGVPAELESSGLVKPLCWKGNYPVIEYDKNKWKKLIYLFYRMLVTMAIILGLVNIATYDHLWWSDIAIPGIVYAGLTMRYSILRHADLGKTVMVETIGMQVLLMMINWVLGYEGWSVNYAVPAIILFVDVAIVFLILVNRLNWQSYFMCQPAITIFSFIPPILWVAGLVTRPLMAAIIAVLIVFVLTMTIFLGDRGVKNELVRRFYP